MPDFRVPAQYLRESFDPDDRLALVLIDRERQEVEQRLLLAEQIASDRFQTFLRASNANGRDVYVGTNPLKPEATGRTKADVREVTHLQLDLDDGGKAALDRIVNAPGMPAPHHVLESSPDKFQLLYRVKGFEPAEAERTMRGLSREFNTDPAATDVSRVMRLPGFRNHKLETPHFVRVVPTKTPDRVWTPADFPRFPERQAEYGTPRFGTRQSPIGSGVDQSRMDFAYAMRQLERGTDPSVIRSRIADYRCSDGKHVNPADYAARTVSAAQQHYLRRGGVSAATAEGETREESGMER